MKKRTKRILSIFLSVVLMFSGIYISDKVQAADGVLSTVTTVSDSTAKPGDIITVTVALQNCTSTASSIDAMKIQVNINTTYFDFVPLATDTTPTYYNSFTTILQKNVNSSNGTVFKRYSGGIAEYSYADPEFPVTQDTGIFSFKVKVKSTLTADAIASLTTTSTVNYTGTSASQTVVIPSNTASINILAANPVILLNGEVNTGAQYTDKVAVSVDKGTAVVSDGTNSYNVTSTSPYTVGADGTYTVTATDAVGHTSTTTFTIKNGVKSIAVTTNPTTTSYIQSTASSVSNVGGKLTVTYNDNRTEIIDLSNAVLSTPDMTTVGTKAVTVTYEGKTTTFNITITAKAVTSISMNTLPTVTSYVEAAATTVSGAGGKITVTYDNNTTEVIDLTNATLTTPDMTTVGTKTVTVTYGGKTTTFDISIVAKSVSSITVKTVPTKNSYPQGTNVDLTGGVLTVNYNNNTSSTVDMTAATVSSFDNTKVGTQTVTISYNGKTTTFSVEVTARKVASFTLSGTTGLSVTEGLPLNVSSVIANVTYDNGDKEAVNVTNTMISYTDAVGTQTVTVTYGGVSQTFTINVIAKVATSISMNTLPTTEYKEGASFSLSGATIVVNYNNNTTSAPINVTSSMISPASPAMTNYGVQQTVTVSYSGFTTTFNYVVQAKQLSSIQVTAPTKTTYIEKNAFSVAGGVVTLVYDNNTTATVSLDAAYCNGYDMSKVGTQTVTVTYSGKTTTFTITVNAKSLSSIAVKTNPTSTTVLEAKDLSLVGGFLTLTYDNGDTEDIDMTKATVSGFNNTKVGTQTVTLTYGGVSTTLSVTVKAKTVTSIEIISNPAIVQYLAGDQFTTNGLAVNAKYDNGSIVDVTSKVVVTNPTISITDSTKTSEVKTVTVSYTEGSVTKTATFTITVITKANVDAIGTDITKIIKDYTNNVGTTVADIDLASLTSTQTTALVDAILSTITKANSELVFDIEKTAVADQINKITDLMFDKAYSSTDATTGINFTAPKGVVRIDSKVVAQNANQFALSEIGKTFTFVNVYEFSNLRNKDNTEVGLNGNLSIKIPMSNELKSIFASLGSNEQVLIAHKLDDGTIEYITPVLSSDVLSFESSLLSPFAIVKVTTIVDEAVVDNGSTNNSDSTTNTNTVIVKTGDASNAITFVFLMVCALGTFTVVAKKRKVKRA